MRMAGGTPSEIRTVVLLETGLASLLGSLVGGLGYLVAHLLAGPAGGPVTANTPGVGISETNDGTTIIEHAPGGRLLPTDVVPHSWLIIVALLLVPAAATAGAVVALRRTAITPFGVIHRDDHRPPSITPAILFLIGTVGLASWQGIFALLPFSLQQSTWLLPAATLPLFLLTLAGLVFGSASLAYHLGRLVAPRTRRPALLIAARRMVDAPYTASRATTAVILAVLLGAAVQGVREAILRETSGYDDPFYSNTFDLLDMVLVVAIGLACASLLVVSAEGVVTRRRTLAALSAGGTSRHTLAAATLWETALPLVPTTLLAAIAGILAARGLYGQTGGDPSGPATVPVPWLPLGALVVGTVLAALVATAVALTFLPRSTSVTELRTAA